ncbi:MAG: hypothetical protein ACKOEO_11875, partial [Planctomycetaceae bacterium]
KTLVGRQAAEEKTTIRPGVWCSAASTSMDKMQQPAPLRRIDKLNGRSAKPTAPDRKDFVA